MLSSFILAVAASANADDPYSQDELNTIKSYFWTNVDVSGTGAVIAAPSTSHPDYAYHWMRDGAISMNIASEVLQNRTIMDAYAQWVMDKTQSDSDPNNIDVRGEPKFFMDGTVYDKPWGRPQNDGPALRAIALINYANWLIANGHKDKVDGVLYNTDGNAKGIKYDLEYVSHHWGDQSFDLWEEIEGDHFFTKMVQRKALVIGAALANSLGDTGAGSFYSQQAAAMETAISAHWNGGNKVIMETIPPHGGPQKYMELDSAVHLGVLYGYAGDNFFAPNNEQVMSSVATYRSSLVGVYAINTADDTAGVAGFLTGRYPNDTYNGYGTGVGNPWILTTQSLAEYYYRTAQAILADHKERNATHMVVTELNAPFLEQVLVSRGYNGPLAAGAKINVVSVALALTSEGDGLIARCKYHIAGKQYHMPEELNLDTGFEQGAPDLTWSYGTLFGALAARTAAVEALNA